MGRFRTGHQSSDFAAMSTLPDSQKEQMCLSLLEEFGCSKIANISSSGEILHSCCLPLGGHKNGDRNPSANLNYQKLTFICWGCGNSGGLLWFIATCRGESTEESRAWLKSETGIGGEQNLGSLLEYFDAIWNPKVTERVLLPKLDERTLSPWLAIHPYMTQNRGIPEDILMKFKIGYASNYRVKISEGEFKDSERIIIPHWWKGNLVGWQSRRIFDDGTSKYINSPDFPKDSTIYNYDAKREAIVVESPMSVLVRYKDCEKLEATFSATVTDRQCRLLANHPKAILFFDNDQAGYTATETVGEALLPYTNVMVVDNPYDADAADLTSTVFNDLVANPIPYTLWKPPKELISYG